MCVCVCVCVLKVNLIQGYCRTRTNLFQSFEKIWASFSKSNCQPASVKKDSGMLPLNNSDLAERQMFFQRCARCCDAS